MRAIKKIVALATGATMVGATIMGAMAADLADYPAPFVDGCSFSGAIVVGEKAAAEDVVGAIDIASALAVSGTATTTEGEGGTTVSASGESVKIETSTRALTFGSDSDGVKEVKTTSIDSGDLPTILADGTFKADDGVEYDYEQKLEFNGDTNLTFKEDSDYNDKENFAGLHIKRNVNFLNYTLDFTKDVESDVTGTTLTDIEDTSVNILGKTYDITTADNASNHVKLVLMGGAIRDILEQGQSKTYTLNDKEYEVEVTYIGGTTSQVKFKVNGEVSDLMVNDDTWKTADGTTLGVREIMEEEAGEVTADQVEFYLGAEKLTLDDATPTSTNGGNKGDNVEIGDEDVDDLYVDIISTTAGGKLTLDKIILSWYPDDDIFVTEDQSATFPGLGSFMVSYEGFTTPYMEEIDVQNNGDQEIELRIPIKSGTATIPLLATNGTGASVHFDAIGGEASDEKLVTTAGATLMFDRDTDEYFVASSVAGEESYLVEVTKIDDTDGVTFKDAVSGTRYENKKVGSAFSIGDVTLTLVNYTETNDNLSLTGAAGNFDRVYSAQGITAWLPVNNTAALIINDTALAQSFVLSFTEEDRNEGISTDTASAGGGGNVSVTLGLTSGGSTTETQVTLSTAQKVPLVNGDYYEIGDTDEFEGYVASDLGTRVLYDTAPDQNTVKLIYHGGESYGNLFVADTHTTFGKVGAGQSSVCKVSVPPAMLDSEVSDVAAQNLIIVGGPCANMAAADVMGVANTIPECLAGFEEGKAMIKMYDTGAGNMAMLVAGATALDTRRASRVLANYGDYALSGSEVEVTGTSLSDISVTKVA